MKGNKDILIKRKAKKFVTAHKEWLKEVFQRHYKQKKAWSFRERRIAEWVKIEVYILFFS